MSIDRGMDKEYGTYLYNGILLKHTHAKKQIMPSAVTWMDPDFITLSQYDNLWVFVERLHDSSYMWNLKKWYKWTYWQNRNRVTDIENRHDYQGERRRGVNWETGIGIYTLGCVCSLSHVRLFVIPWTVADQAALSMGFSRQEYWGGLPCLPPGDLPSPGIEPGSLALQADSLPSKPPGKPDMHTTTYKIDS